MDCEGTGVRSLTCIELDIYKISFGGFYFRFLTKDELINQI